eukprot:5495633-Prorocentrum_lima.AAC.1
MPRPPSPPGHGGAASSGAGPKDWNCHDCGRDNWVTRTECRFCATRRPPTSRGRAASRTAARNTQAFRP